MYEIELTFTGINLARANILSEDLRNHLESIHKEISVEQIQTDPNNMDLGATLGVILGSAAVTAVAKGIQIWLAKNQDVDIEIHKDGSIKARGLRSKDALELTRIITSKE